MVIIPPPMNLLLYLLDEDEDEDEKEFLYQIESDYITDDKKYKLPLIFRVVFAFFTSLFILGIFMSLGSAGFLIYLGITNIMNLMNQ